MILDAAHTPLQLDELMAVPHPGAQDGNGRTIGWASTPS